jgi:predicted DCC family thiol-disulfide oxidoreductase YuxK
LAARLSERPYTLVYDGDCRLCTRSADLVATWDRGGVVEIVPFQRGGVPERFPWISDSAYREAMQLVGPGDETWSGAAAAERLVKILPGGRSLGCLFALPFARPIADRVYRLIARNRTRFGCGTHCPVPRAKGRSIPEG